MKKLKVKPLPLVMTVLSALYFIYVAASKDTVLNADAVGGDPGGKVLPYIMAVFMFLGFLWITIKERPEKTESDRETLMLFLVTLGLSVVYILLMRTLGFVVLTVVLLYTLLYLYTTIGEKRSLKQAVAGGLGTLLFTSAVYMLFRYVTKTLLRLGRRGVIPPFFGNTTVTGVVSILIVALFAFLYMMLADKKLKARGLGRISTAAVITMTAVLFLYIVFRQFFLVGLAPGLLNY